jgi:hypothetical protein
MAETIVGEGWATRQELERMTAALRDWGRRPDAFMSWLGWVR